ncbi:MAG TPA: right-handed parallel beta-helix repeat-containing protein, partial [Methylomirabilota bacterium]|nr:right-handed parallel beta-helix repeat-containing protein [Methylomirabilota bacterium]
MASASVFVLALISTLNIFAAASFKPLPYTDPFPPAVTAGGTTYCQPPAAVVLNENLLGVTLPFTRALPAGWQSGMGAITVEFWLRQKAFSQPTLDPIRDNPDGVIVHGPGFEVGANFLFGNPVGGGPGSIVATFSQTKGGAFLANRPISIALEPSDQQWHQYVLTYDLRTVRTYRDGELIDQKWMDNNTERLGPIENDAGDIFAGVMEIGSSSVPNSRRFNNGFLDSVRVSNVALDPWQVRRNFENARSYTKTLHVAAGASDAGAGTQGSPTSLRTALTQVGANTRIVLQAGTYNGADFQVTRSALSKREHCLITGADGSAPAIISGGTPTMSAANYIYLRNLTFSSDSGNALNINNSLGVTVDSCRISGAQKGIVVNGSAKLSVQNCVVNVGNTGIQLINSPNNVVRNNTVVNGTVGIQFDAGANHASALNNIMSGQSSASLVINGNAQQRYRGNGNLYNPASEIAAVLPGGNYSTVQVRDKSFAHAWYIIDTNEVSDPGTRRGGYAAESQSMAFAPTFADPANGDFRLASNLGNALDAGADRTFQRTVTSPAYDSLGTPRPQGNGYDIGAFESVGAAYAVFNLNAGYTTSAGVYKPDGTLVKTLFSGRRMAAGTNVVFWNGLDDSNQIAPGDTYTIKMVAHNVQYIWENVVGNSSVPNTGESVHNGFEPMKAMTFNGTTAFYTSGYNENHLELNRFDASNPNKLTKIFGPKTLITTDSITDVAADTADLYAMNSSTVAVYSQGGLNLTRTINTGGGNSHVEVQKSGSLLFVSKKTQNTIAIYNKATGVQSGSISVNQPGDLSITASGDLWVVSGTSVIRYSVSGVGGTVAQTIGGFSNPIAVACSPVDGTVLVADASTWQIKAFNSAGAAIWTHGQAGGFANGPRVTPDKFYWVFIDQGRTFTETYLQFQPDGTWWVGDTFLSRSLHFNMNRQLLHEINYQPHTYMASVDVNNGTRVFNRFTEYHVDYSKPAQQAWTITNFWGFGLPAYAFSFDDGVCSPVTMSNGRTYALMHDDGGGAAGWTRQVVELTSTGVRETPIKRIGNYTRISKDGSIYGQSGGGVQTYWRKSFTGFDGNANPVWGAQTTIASANVSNGYLTSDPLSEKHPLQTTNGTVVIYDPAKRTGYHLGGIKPGGNQWLWRAMPTIGGLNGCGNADSWVEYGGNYHMVAGRNIFAGFHGEFFQDAGQSGQFFHYLDNGLFIGQFGQPLLFGVVVNPPGGSGNNFAPALVEVGTNVFLYHNDEPGRGSHRWRATGLSDIRELAASVIVGQAPTNNPGATNV